MNEPEISAVTMGTPRVEVDNGGGDGAPIKPAPAPAAVERVETRGRHRKDCRCPICNQRRGKTGGGGVKVENSSRQSAPPVPLIDRQMVEDFAGQLLEIADELITRKIYAATLRASNGSEQTAAEIAGDCKLTDKEKVTIRKLTGVIVEKYRIGTQYAPEAILAFCVGGWLYRSYRATKALQEMVTVAAARKPETIQPEKPDSK